MDKDPETHEISHPWKARLIVGVVILILAFIGLIIVDLYQKGAWIYWRIMVPVIALLCIWLSWYLRKKKHSMSLVKIWHELLHWVGLFLAVYLVSIFVNLGLIGRFAASLVIITLLALTTFIAGIYIETTFIILGFVLGFFTIGASLLAVYIYSVMLPIVIGAAGLIFWMVYRKRYQKPTANDE